MKREDFIKQLKSSGVPSDRWPEVMATRRAEIGAFDDDIANAGADTLRKEKPALPEKEAAAKKSGFTTYITSDVPNVVRGARSRLLGRAETVSSPTRAGEALGLSQGSLAEGIVSTPERLGRSALGAGASLADLGLGVPLETALRGANRLSGGRLKETLVPLVQKAAQKAYGAKLPIPGGQGTEIGPYLKEQWNELTPAERANWKAAGWGFESLGAAKAPALAGKAAGGTIAMAGKGTELSGKVMEAVGTKRIHSTIKPKTSLLKNIEGVGDAEKIKNFAGTLKDYKLEGLVNKPSELAIKAEHLANMHVDNADKLIEYVTKHTTKKYFNPINEIDKRLEKISEYAPAGEYDIYRGALEKVKKDLVESGYGFVTKNGAIQGKNVSLNKIKEIKSLLRREGSQANIYEAGSGALKEVKKKAITSLNDAIEDLVPEISRDKVLSYRMENEQAKKLFNIANIARHEDYKSLTKKPSLGSWLLTSGIGAFVPSVATAYSGSLTDAAAIPLGVMLATGARAAGRGITSPKVAIPAGRGMQNLGRFMQHKPSEVTPLYKLNIIREALNPKSAKPKTGLVPLGGSKPKSGLLSERGSVLVPLL